MQKIFFVFFCLFLVSIALGQTMAKLYNGLLADGQFVILKDTDGFVYVRENHLSNLKLLTPLPQVELFIVKMALTAGCWLTTEKRAKIRKAIFIVPEYN
jgi:hypothetical protein